MAEHHKTCAHCGVGFVARTARARFCSKKCASRHLYLADPEKARARKRDWSQKKAGIKPAPNCIQCGMSMKGRRADTKFCSRRCSRRSAQGKSDESYASRQCAECGASIAHKNMNAKFCGTLCRGRSLRRAKRSASSHRDCACCGEPFPLRMGNVKYCANCGPIVAYEKTTATKRRYREKPDSQDKERLRYNSAKSAGPVFRLMQINLIRKDGSQWQ